MLAWIPASRRREEEGSWGKIADVVLTHFEIDIQIHIVRLPVLPVEEMTPHLKQMRRHLKAFESGGFVRAVWEIRELPQEKLAEWTDACLESFPRPPIIMAALIDGEGNRTEWVYDSMGRLSTEIYADGTDYHYAYDDRGRLLTRTDAMGQSASYAYDVADQLATVDYPTDTDVTTVYDSLGRMESRVDAAGQWLWTYDGNAGRVLTETDPDGNVTSYTYDATG